MLASAFERPKEGKKVNNFSEFSANPLREEKSIVTGEERSFGAYQWFSVLRCMRISMENTKKL